MLPRTPRRLPAATWLAALLALAVIACAGAATSPPTTQAPASPPGSAPAPSPGLGALDPDALMAAAGDLDGQAVRVAGFFLATGDTARLCSVVLESYPPQCGGATIRLTGQVPAGVLDGLDKTTEPGLTQATWGWVNVTGTVRASGPDGLPVLEIATIDLDDSGA